MVDQDVAGGGVIQEDNSAAWITQDCHASQRKNRDTGVCGRSNRWRVGILTSMYDVVIAVCNASIDVSGYDALKSRGDLAHMVCGVLQTRQS